MPPDTSPPSPPQMEPSAPAPPPLTLPTPLIFPSAVTYQTLEPAQSRLSLPYPLRIPTATVLGFIGGLSLGASQGGTMAGMRFRAENAHRFPTSSTGWYLYHKTKNYKMLVASVKEGAWMGAKVAVWTTGFFVLEEYVDQERGGRDFVSSAVAGLGVAGGFSLWNMFSLTTTVRTLQTGLYGGFAFGVMQDLLALARGRRVRYVDFVMETLGVKERDLLEETDT